MGGCVSNNQSPRVITTDSAPKHNKDAASKEFSGVESTKNKPSSSPVVTPEPLAAKGDRGSLSSINRLSLNRHLTLPPLNTQIPPSPTSCTKTIGTKPLIHALSPTHSHDASYRAPYLEVTVNSTNTNASNGGGGSGGRGRHSSDSITKSPTLNPISPSLASRINISPGKRPPTPTFRALSILPTSPKNGAMNSKLQGNPSPSNKNSLPAELLALRTRHLRSSSLPEMQLQDLKCFQATSPKSPHRSPQLLKVNSNDEQEMEAAETKVVEPMSPNGAQALLSRRKSIANLQIKPFDGLLDSVKVKGKSRITQRRASECGMSIPIMPLESMKTFHALTSATLASSTSSDSNTQEKEETKSTNLFGGVGNSKSPPLASIFDEYAVGAERMKYRHVLHLCNDLIDAFIEGYRQRVEKELKEKSSKTGEIPSSKSIETQMNIDLPYMLGDGVHKDKTKWVEIAARRMWKLLDFNNEGFVSKKKFIARFMKSCEEVLNVNQLKKLNGVQDGNMKDPCMIM